MARFVVWCGVCVGATLTLGPTLLAAGDAPRARATVTWITDNSGFWDVGANWSTGTPPAAGDDVIIDRPGASPTITIRNPIAPIATLTANELVQIDASFGVSGTATFNGGFRIAASVGSGGGAYHFSSDGEWRSGTIGLGGTFTVHPGRTLTVTTSATKGMSNITLLNQGTVVWTEGLLQTGLTVAITNDVGALFDVQGTLVVSPVAAGAKTFANAGTFRRSSGAGDMAGIGMQFTNTGSIEVQSGTLGPFNPALTTSGLLAVSAGATLNAGGVTLQAGSTFAGAGTLLLSGTNIAGNVTVTIPTIIAGPSSIGGTGTLTIGAPASWVSGTVEGSGGIVVAPGQTLTLTTAAAKMLSNTTLTNHGTVVWTDGQLNLNSAVTITNAAGAVFEAQNNLTMGVLTSGTRVFVNAGTLRKSGPLGTLAVGMLLVTSGVVEIRIASVASFDVIWAPTMTLGGTLRVVHTGGFTPVLHDAMQSMTTLAGRTGQFTTIDSPPIYLAVYGSHTVTLKYSAAPPLTELIRNGDFSNGQSNWLTFALPNPTNIAAGVSNGVMQFNRVGGGTQATVYQETEAFVPAGGALVARFDIWNTSTVRKRVSVLIIESTFADLFVCTFWLPPNSQPQTYQMRTHTTQVWQNAAIYFYAASPSLGGGAYNLDNVSLQHDLSVSNERTDCVDPTTPLSPGTADGPELLGNGDFSTGTLAPWGTFGNITQQIAGGVFQFHRPPPTVPTPAGVILQPTDQAMTAGQFLTATFQLGNSSGVRKRVTVLLHDNNFSDLAACTFWLAPGQPLSDHAIRMFATQAWANATLSIYPATTDSLPWILLDNATLRRTPSQALLGTECLEPGSTNLRAVSGGRAPVGNPLLPVASRVPEQPRLIPIDLVSDASGRETLLAWIPANVKVRIEVSLDGETWSAIHIIEAGDAWLPIELAPGLRIRLVVVPGSPPPSP